jgi:penicillin-binding protein 1A
MQNDNKIAEKKTDTTQSTPKKRKKKMTGIAKFMIIFHTIFWGLFIAGTLTVGIIFKKIATGEVGYMPALEELQNPSNRFASEVISADMESMGRYYKSANRVTVQYDEISPNVINALIATEDIRYNEHTGVDFRSLMRAIVKMGKAGGGSTITQQLAKQLWSPQANSFEERALQKPIEWVIATKLERLYSKEEILTMYLNQFDFLYNAVGIKSAAHVYFNTTPDKLKIEEAAMLIGMCKNPALYNPLRKPEDAFYRRNTVLDQMCKYDFITQEECDSIQKLPVNIKFMPIDHKEGIAPYFREHLRKIMTAKEPDLKDYPSWNKSQYDIDRYQWENNPLYGWCHKNRKKDGTPYNLYEDGLRIYTTIDSRMQQHAEEAVKEHMMELQQDFFKEKKKKSYAPFGKKMTKKEIDGIMERSMRQTDRYYGLQQEGMTDDQIREVFNTPTKMHIFSYDGPIDTIMTPMDSIRWTKHFLRCGFVSMDTHTGAVKAYVGGPNFEYFQYDMVSSGRRQVGSTLKPFLYTLAMNEGQWPCDTVKNEPVTLIDKNGKEWTPRDSHTKNQGETVTLTWGLSRSSNWITAYLMSQYTPEQLVATMRSLGITGPIDPVVSLCLGPCEISVQEMASAYTTYANRGVRVDPLYVTRIEDINGNVLATFGAKKHEVISEENAYKMLHMLRAVMDEGTGIRARSKYKLKGPMGGKTGTSQNHSDGWFVGFTPSLVNAVWVGGEDRSIHFDQMSLGQGANTSLPIWSLYMQKVYEDKTLFYDKNESFDVPTWFKPNKGCQ